MSTIKIAQVNETLCSREQECPASLSCPIGAISRTKEGGHLGPAKVDARRCLGCGQCMRFCTANAITLI